MRNTLRTLIIVLVAIITALQANAQQVAIDFIELTGRNVIVHYTLDDGSSSTRQFLIQLYSSQDNFTTPLTRVTGDVGSEVSAGFDKKIVWNITQELGAYEGDISLEIRGRVYVPFVKLNIPAGAIYKRGKNYPLNWTSGNLSGIVNIELFNEDGERIWGENNVPNVGKFDWYLPSNVKKGNNYRLKFTNTKDRNDVVMSQPLIIKPKIPFLVKVGATAIIGTAAVFILTRKASEDKLDPYGDPPGPTNNQ